MVSTMQTSNRHEASRAYKRGISPSPIQIPRDSGLRIIWMSQFFPDRPKGDEKSNTSSDLKSFENVQTVER